MISLLAAATLSSACVPLPGAEAVWRDGAQVVVVGEVHGTREIPKLTGDLLCAAVAQGRRPVLALEAAPPDGQAAVDLYLASAGSPADRERLARAQAFTDRFARGSHAVLDLVETARRLNVDVVLYDPVKPASGPTDDAREQAMAEALMDAAATAPVIALTGVGHADRTAFNSLSPPVSSMIRRMGAVKVVSLAPASQGGEGWACRAPSPGAAPSACGVHPLPRREPLRDRGLVLDPSLRSGFDGLYSVGAPFSASPPAGLPQP